MTKEENDKQEVTRRLQEHIARVKAAMEFLVLKRMELHSMSYVSMMCFERAKRELDLERSFLGGTLWEAREQIGADRQLIDPATRIAMSEAEQLLRQTA
jgi:hypothetical protein